MALLNGWLGLILGFSGLIFIHELGHFVLAKWNGVRVYVFSLGMGPYLLSFSYKGTVYVLSMIPIGGYVKMMGQDDLNPAQDASPNPYDYRNKRAGQKAAILAAGAGFNITFTIAVFTLCYYVGMDLESPRIGNIVPESPLAQAVIKRPTGTEPASLAPGDRIIAVNGVPVKSMGEAALQIASSRVNEEVLLEIDRAPLKNMVYVKTRLDKEHGASTIGLEQYIEKQRLALGIRTTEKVMVLKDPEKDTPAKTAGLQKGDVILQVDGLRAEDRNTCVNAIRASKGKTLTLTIERQESTNTKEILVPVIPKLDDAGNYIMGVLLATVQKVTVVDADSQAYKAGMRPGVYFLSFVPTDDRWEDDKRVFSRGKVEWVKDLLNENEKPSSVEIANVKEATENNQDSVIVEHSSMYPYKASGGFLDALSVSWTDTMRGAGSVFTVLHGLLSGNISPKALSGPYGIGEIIFQVSRSQAFIRYLWFLGFISLNLGVLQFVPIPLLDGWHLVEVAIEKLKGSPIAPKIQQAFQMAGLAIVGTLLLYVTYQDFTR